MCHLLSLLTNTLEFNLGPDKRYLKLSETQLSLQIELPANYWPDNDVVSKLFENLELSLNHETVSHKSSAFDYPLTNHFMTKVTFDDSYVGTTMDTNGIFDPLDCDQDVLSTFAARLRRDEKSELFHKEIVHEGEHYMQPWHRYYFSVLLNCPLARTTDCLPNNLPISIRLHRASANFAIIKLSDKITLKKKNDETLVSVDYAYTPTVIPVINPVLSAYYAYSVELEQAMSRIKSSNYEIPIVDMVARRTVLDGGLMNFELNLLQGRLPKYIIFALSSLERLSGTETLSLTKFVQGQLDSFDLMLGELISIFVQGL